MWMQRGASCAPRQWRVLLLQVLEEELPGGCQGAKHPASVLGQCSGTETPQSDPSFQLPPPPPRQSGRLEGVSRAPQGREGGFPGEGGGSEPQCCSQVCTSGLRWLCSPTGLSEQPEGACAAGRGAVRGDAMGWGGAGRASCIREPRRASMQRPQSTIWKTSGQVGTCVPSCPPPQPLPAHSQGRGGK